jgi:hypothetical protein
MEDHDLVGVADRVNTMGNRYARLVSHDSVEGVLNFLFVGAVKSGGGFVEKQQAGLAQDDPRDGHSLLLSAGDVGALDSDILVEASPVVTFLVASLLDSGISFDFLDFGVEVALVGSGDHFLPGGVEAIVDDIFFDAVVEEHRFLADHSHAGSQVVDVVVFDVYAIDEDLPHVGVVEALQKLMNGRFAAARGTNEAYLLPSLDLEAEIFEDGLISGGVLESHISEDDVSVDGRGQLL